MRFLRPFLIGGGIIAMLTGFFMMILGKILGVLLIFAGFGMTAVFFALMFYAGGYRPEGAFFNGLGGQGRQQSEVSKMPQSSSGEQPANI